MLGAAALAAGVALLVWQQSRNGAETPVLSGPMHAAASEVPRQDAVVVFGASGKLGRQIVLQVWLAGPKLRYWLFCFKMQRGALRK